MQFGAACVAVGPFSGCARMGLAAFDKDDVRPPYLAKAFVYLGGRLARMADITPWAQLAVGGKVNFMPPSLFYMENY